MFSMTHILLFNFSSLTRIDVLLWVVGIPAVIAFVIALYLQIRQHSRLKTELDQLNSIKHYNIETKGKKVTVVGRSLVIGKPVALLLTTANATVTVCHTKTVDMEAECRNADIIVACCGVAKLINENYVKPGQIVIDVGMNVDENGKLCGDVDYEKVSGIAEAATPVPGGVGSITTAILLKHVVDNAERQV